MAAVTGDILALLDKIPIWRRLQETPARMDALEKRVAELEALLAKAPGAVCPSCGDRGFRVTSSVQSSGPFGRLGAKDVTRKCQACGFQDTELVTPK